MIGKRAASRRAAIGDRPDRAVIDIGSNTVRLVIYSGSKRAPAVWLNEKVTAKLGRDLAATGRMPEKSIQLAMSGIARFAAILSDMEIDDVQVVATAAARDAENGPEFLEQIRALGLEPRLLSGEEEAITSAYGVIGAFPRAKGVVADLGGGSLELVSVSDGQCHEAVSLPLGTLRLPALREDGDAAFRKAVNKQLRDVKWAKDPAQPLYLVGGTWRALAAYAMHKGKYPLSDPHSFYIDNDKASRIAKKVSRMDPAQLSEICDISSSRAAGLPDAAAMLRVMLTAFKPDGLLFSSWGLREGLLFQRLEDAARMQDPLLTAIAHFVSPRGASMPEATMLAGWTSCVASPEGNGAERLRLAAIMLAMAQTILEPNMRLKHSIDWALDKRWVGLDHRGRARIAAALRGACGKPEPTPELLKLTSERKLREAASWGLAFRLCRRIGAGSRASMLTSRLTKEDSKLVLWLDKSREQLASDSIQSDLKTLANWLDLEPELQIGE